jgi:hypothetical protein
MVTLNSTSDIAPPPSKQAKRSFDLNRQRRRDIARLVVHRHGKLARANLCMLYVAAAAWHCPSDSERRFLLVQWCGWVCAPPSVERQIDAILKANPARRMRADTLARHLSVNDTERTALRIWTIGANDMSKAERAKRRKDKHRLREQSRRQARGGNPREASFSRTKPWEAFGIKRRAWERRGKPTPPRRKFVRTPTTQIRAHDTYLPSGHEFASLSTAAAKTPAGAGYLRLRGGRTPRKMPINGPASGEAAAFSRVVNASADINGMPRLMTTPESLPSATPVRSLRPLECRSTHFPVGRAYVMETNASHVDRRGVGPAKTDVTTCRKRFFECSSSISRFVQT